jgi:hypothetical protein
VNEAKAGREQQPTNVSGTMNKATLRIPIDILRGFQFVSHVFCAFARKPGGKRQKFKSCEEEIFHLSRALEPAKSFFSFPGKTKAERAAGILLNFILVEMGFGIMSKNESFSSVAIKSQVLLVAPLGFMHSIRR